MIVLDASVIIKWIQEEEYSDKARLLRKDHLARTNQVVIPSLLYYEVANTLATKTHISSKNVKTGLNLIYRASLITYKESPEDIITTSTLAKKHKTTFYDMLYAVLAKKKKCVLVTADNKFIDKTRFKFVKHISEVG